VGVRSPVATQLPAEAFFVRHGQRVVENGRYHLDLRHPAAVKHLDEVVDYVVGDLGAGYLKLDYNINGGPGTEAGNVSAGAGLLACNRAHLEWLDAVLDRHPGLVIENCASGGMRMDYAMLARLQLQSTSDQQDFLRYPPITAAAPAAVTPEQAATWAYPQPGFSDREIAFTLCGALLGRVHLSGHIDQMSARQQRLVADAVDVYKRIRADLAGALPFWPLGLPGWADSWLALGMRAATAAYVIAWRRGPAVGPRGGPAGTDPAEMALRVDCLRGRPATAEVLYPRAGQPPVSWDPGRGELSIVLPATPAACLVRIAAG
jgi:alpha-galactosidase